jgi:hypothetical protein
VPYDAGDVGRVMATSPGISLRKVSRVLKFSRAEARDRGMETSPNIRFLPYDLIEGYTEELVGRIIVT